MTPAGETGLGRGGAFLVEPEPARGAAEAVAADVLRLVARNPGRMTYHGTNTYLVPDGDGFLVVDPGPAEDPSHVGDILRATGGRVTGILVSHGHADHIGALPRLREATGAPVYAFHRPLGDLVPDVPLADGGRVGPFTALHTPGHAPDHLCFARDDGLVFTGDHVMGWSSSVVPPPSGDMCAFVDSLQRLADRDDPLYLPGHGPTISQPAAFVLSLRKRRLAREREILGAVRATPGSVQALAATLYAKADPVLQNAAERNVLAHLIKLAGEGRVVDHGGVWSAA